MKYFKIVLVVLVAVAMTSSAISITARAYSMTVQGQSTALERGYRTGYSDGYSAGSRDVSDHATALTTKHGERLRTIATVTSRVSRSDTQPDTNSVLLTLLCQRISRAGTKP